MPKLMIITAITIVLFISAISYYSASFIWVLVAPIPVLLLCFYIIFSQEDKVATRFFGFTDLAYYLIIGAVIGLGTRYLPELDDIMRKQAELTYTQAKSALPAAENAEIEAKKRHQSASSNLETISPQESTNCLARQLEARAMRRMEVDPQPHTFSIFPDYPPGCEFTLSAKDHESRAHSAYINSLQNLTEINRIIRTGPGEARVLIGKNQRKWILLKLFPILILCGVTLKVGKTILSIRKAA